MFTELEDLFNRKVSKVFSQSSLRFMLLFARKVAKSQRKYLEKLCDFATLRDFFNSIIFLKFLVSEFAQNHTYLHKSNIKELVLNELHWVHANL